MKYKHVALIGVDGAGSFFRKANTPNIDRIFENGAVSFEVLTAEPTISAECWGSMLLGVKPELHGLTNEIVVEKRYDVNSKYPSIFRVIRDQIPDAVLASFCNWSPINFGIIESNLDVYEESCGDEQLTPKICDYVIKNKPTMLFVQFDEVDEAGHNHVYGSEIYLNQIATEDGYIGKIFDAYTRAGIIDDTLFMVTADHGGIGQGHGGSTDDEKYVMFAATGKHVPKGEIKNMVIRDTPAIIADALGLKMPETWDSKVPEGLK